MMTSLQSHNTVNEQNKVLVRWQTKEPTAQQIAANDREQEGKEGQTYQEQQQPSWRQRAPIVVPEASRFQSMGYVDSATMDTSCGRG
jgi:hypothetical protein